MISKDSTTKNDRAFQLSANLKSLLVVTVVIFSSAACRAQSSAANTQNLAAAPVTTTDSPRAAITAQGSYADVVSRVSPAVVTINATRRARAASAERNSNPLFNDPRFREFFGDRFPQQQTPQRGLGSGVVVTADGYILTNNHVVEGADEVTVEMGDRRTVTAKVVGTDPASDLAVLKINQTNLAVLPLGDSDKVRVGDVALAVGNPLGVGQTVTAGIISAKGRSTGIGDGTSFEEFIQTDAPINRGNSGGALINTTGELIGINSQILSPTGGSIGIGFAIPSNMAKNVMDQLIKNGKVRRSLLGVTLRPVDSDLAESLNLKEVRGAIVNSVQPGSPAAQAGLRTYDVITGLNGTAVADSNTLRNQIAAQTPGSEITLTVLRDGREQQVKARVVERTEETAREGGEDGREGGPGQSGSGGSAGRLGFSVEAVTPAQVSQLNLPAGTQGLIVTEVEAGGPAAEAFLTEGDVVQEVTRQQVRSIAELRAAVQASGERPVLMLVRRGQQTRLVTLRPRAAQQQ